MDGEARTCDAGRRLDVETREAHRGMVDDRSKGADEPTDKANRPYRENTAGAERCLEAVMVTCMAKGDAVLDPLICIY